MKSSQILITIVAVIGLIGGLTFVRQYVNTGTANIESENPTKIDDEIKITWPPSTVAPSGGEYELHASGHHEFWFRNQNAFPIDLGLEQSSCTCSRVEVTALSSEEEKRFLNWLPLAAAAEVADPCQGLLPTLGPAVGVRSVLLGEIMGRPERWHNLKVQGEKVTQIPAETAGIIRLAWETKRIGPIRLTSKMWVQAEGKPKTRGDQTSLEVPIIVVPPFQVYPDEWKVPDLDTVNHEFTSDFVCWSATRSIFDLKAREESNDPFFSFTCTPLEGEELDYPRARLRELGFATVVKVYRVRVTVHERLADGREMDVGPYYRTIQLSSPDQPDFEPVKITVAGTVRGEVMLGGEGEDRDRGKLVLRVFPADEGITQEFALESIRPGLKLTLKRSEPMFLKADLKQLADVGGCPRWTLTVTIPPNSVTTGKLPERSAVYLQAEGSSSRQIRIPVLGKATVALSGH